LVAGLCFSLGGFVAHVNWLRYRDGVIWLPLIVLFFRRAILAAATIVALRDSAVAGLVLGMVVLAGCLHLAMMDALVVGSRACYLAVAHGWRDAWKRSLLAVLVTGTA